MLILDHIVHHIESIDSITKNDVFKRLNIKPGGRHLGRPTFNHLLHFGHSYIEFLSIEDKQKLESLQHIENSMIDNIIKSNYKEGFVRFVLQTDNIASVKKLLNNHQIKTIGPVTLSRKDNNGKVITWKLLFPMKPTFNINLPYFIEWDEGYDARMARLKKEEFIKNSSENVSAISINSLQNKKTALLWATIFNKSVKEISDNLFELKFDSFSIHFHKNELFREGIFNVHINNSLIKGEEVLLAGAKYLFD